MFGLFLFVLFFWLFWSFWFIGLGGVAFGSVSRSQSLPRSKNQTINKSTNKQIMCFLAFVGFVVFFIFLLLFGFVVFLSFLRFWEGL